MSSTKLQAATRIQGEEPSIWVEFGELIEKYQAIPLSRGSPDFLPPENLTKALQNATTSSNVLLNQYTRSYGHLRLVNVLSELYGKVTGHSLDAKTQILVTIGAYEALYCSILGNVNPGDEVIIFEPYFDCYVPMIKMAGGIPVYMPLRQKDVQQPTSDDWVLDFEELATKFNSKTKAVILNSPHNPTGKVFNKEELQSLAELVKRWDTLVISDEVYEWLVFDDKPFTRMSTLPGMWERTISIGSAGKTFSATGWKIGWAYGPKNLIANLQAIHQNSVYTSPTPIQEAIAEALENEVKLMGSPESYSHQLRLMLQSKRDEMMAFCWKAGLKPIAPSGSYFMLVDYSDFVKNLDYEDGSNSPRDYKVCRWMIREKRLAALPVTCFYSPAHRHIGENYFRLAFVKAEGTLSAAKDIFLNINKS